MAETTQRITIDEGAGHVFDHLRDVGQLHRYVERLERAEPGTGDSVRLQARLPERNQPGEDVAVEGEGWFRTDPDNRRIEWGLEGPHDYEGSLEITGDDTRSEVTVRISTQRTDDGALAEEMRTAMDHLKKGVESGAEASTPGPRHQADQTTAADAGLVG